MSLRVLRIAVAAALLVPASGAFIFDAAAREPQLSAMTCRLRVRVRAAPDVQPVLVLRRGPGDAGMAIGVPPGTVLEPVGPLEAAVQRVRWEGGQIGFIEARFTEDFAECSGTPVEVRRPRGGAVPAEPQI